MAAWLKEMLHPSLAVCNISEAYRTHHLDIKCIHQVVSHCPAECIDARINGHCPAPSGMTSTRPRSSIEEHHKPGHNMRLALQGTLFKYAGRQGNCAFRTGAARCALAPAVARAALTVPCLQLHDPYCISFFCQTVNLPAPGSHRRHLVLVGGLGDALLFAKYTAVLASQLDSIGWCAISLLAMLRRSCVYILFPRFMMDGA